MRFIDLVLPREERQRGGRWLPNLLGWFWSRYLFGRSPGRFLGLFGGRRSVSTLARFHSRAQRSQVTPPSATPPRKPIPTVRTRAGRYEGALRFLKVSGK